MPLDAINPAPAREKSIRHGHPSTACAAYRREVRERGEVCRVVAFRPGYSPQFTVHG